MKDLDGLDRGDILTPHHFEDDVVSTQAKEEMSILQ